MSCKIRLIYPLILHPIRYFWGCKFANKQPSVVCQKLAWSHTCPAQSRLSFVGKQVAWLGDMTYFIILVTNRCKAVQQWYTNFLITFEHCKYVTWTCHSCYAQSFLIHLTQQSSHTQVGIPNQTSAHDAQNCWSTLLSHLCWYFHPSVVGPTILPTYYTSLSSLFKVMMT